MTRLYAILLSLLGLALLPQSAGATLLSFEIESRMTPGCGACVGFEEDTGLTLSGDPLSVVARFTIDTGATAAIGQGGATAYRFNQPGTGLSVTVGQLTYFYGMFSLELADTFFNGACNLFTVYSGLNAPSAELGRSTFGMSNCNSSAGPLADHSLATLASTDMSTFGASGFETATSNPGRTDPLSWFLQGHVTKIASVPEPGTLALFSLGLFGVALLRRR